MSTNLVLEENNLIANPTGNRLICVNITVSFLIPSNTHLNENFSFCIPNPVKAFAGKYFSSESVFASYMEHTLSLPPDSSHNSYKAFPATLLTFSIPPVLEKVRSVRNRIFLGPGSFAGGVYDLCRLPEVDRPRFLISANDRNCDQCRLPDVKPW